jgi:hypothetical protein
LEPSNGTLETRLLALQIHVIFNFRSISIKFEQVLAQSKKFNPKYLSILMAKKKEKLTMREHSLESKDTPLNITLYANQRANRLRAFA